MSVETILRLRGDISPEQVASALSIIYNKAVRSDVKPEIYEEFDPVNGKDWMRSVVCYRDDKKWINTFGPITVDVGETVGRMPTRSLFYSASSINTHENLDYYVYKGLADPDDSLLGTPKAKPLTEMIFGRTTYLSLGAFGKSVDIMMRLLAYFDGGWLDENDCDDEPFRYISKADALRNLKAYDEWCLSEDEQERARALNEASGWGFTTEQLLLLGRTHADARIRGDANAMGFIDCRLTDANFHTPAKLLFDGEYGLFEMSALYNAFETYVEGKARATKPSEAELSEADKLALGFGDKQIYDACADMQKLMEGKEQVSDAELLRKKQIYGKALNRLEERKTCISLQALFEYLSKKKNVNSVKTAFGQIDRTFDGDDVFYDFTSPLGVCCMDGEECVVLSNDGETVSLSASAENPSFKLSRREFEVARFAQLG